MEKLGHREIKSIFNRIHSNFGNQNLELAREKLEAYAKKKDVVLPPIQFFTSSTIYPDALAILYSESKGHPISYGIRFNKADTLFTKRKKIAISLSSIILDCIPKTCHESTSVLIKDDMIYYLANKILIHYSHSSGSILRCKYAGSTEQIELLEEENKLLSDLLTYKEREHTGKIFDEVFNCIPISTRDPREWLLRNEKKLIIDDINRYRESKYKLMTYESFDTNKRGKDEAIGKLNIRDNYKQIYIQYPHEDDINTKRRQRSGATFDDPLLVIRMIMAHELGHLVLHTKIPSGSDDNEKVIIHDHNSELQDREATYYARLVLEHREFLYNDMQDDDDYKEACEAIHNYIRMYFSKKEKTWLEWVLSDEERSGEE